MDGAVDVGQGLRSSRGKSDKSGARLLVCVYWLRRALGEKAVIGWGMLLVMNARVIACMMLH